MKRDLTYLYTDTVFLVGNGASRKDFDLNKLKDKGTIIGCNALYREFSPDILVVQDAKMARELHDSKYPGLILTGKGIYVGSKNVIRWQPSNTRTSGAFAMNYIAKIIKPSKCYMLGMDGYKGNCYEGTPNYYKTPSKYEKIVSQYQEIENNINTKFINVNNRSNWTDYISYNEFEKKLMAS